MEHLKFHFENGRRKILKETELVGVVGSGNLEVLVTRAPLNSGCEIEIQTAATGFSKIWEAVITDFQAHWQLADVRLQINDMGATPAVVRLRLDQAIQSVLQGPL